MRRVDLENLEEMINRDNKKSNVSQNNLRYAMARGKKVVNIHPSNFYGVLGDVHRVKVGKYPTLVACTKGVDNNCTICNYINEAWDMINKVAEETIFDLPEDKKAEAKKTVQRDQMSLIQEKGFEKATMYAYYAVAVLRNADLTTKTFKANEFMDYKFEDGSVVSIPAFDIKIKRITPKKLKELRELFISDELEFNSGVVVTTYPDTDDSLALGRDKIVKAFDNEKVLGAYPKLLEAIDEEMLKVFKGKEVTNDGETHIEYDTTVFESVYQELSVDRAKKLEYTGVYNNVLGLWNEYLEYSKEHPETTYISFRESKGSVKATPGVNLNGGGVDNTVTTDNNIIASAEAVEDDDNLPF